MLTNLLILATGAFIYSQRHKIWNAIKNSAETQNPAELNEPLLQKCPRCKGAQKYWNGNIETDCDCKDGKTLIICDATLSHYRMCRNATLSHYRMCRNQAYGTIKIFWPLHKWHLCKQHLSDYNSVPKFLRVLGTFFLFVPLVILLASFICSDEPGFVFLFGIAATLAASVLGGYFLLLVLGLKNE